MFQSIKIDFVQKKMKPIYQNGKLITNMIKPSDIKVISTSNKGKIFNEEISNGASIRFNNQENKLKIDILSQENNNKIDGKRIFNANIKSIVNLLSLSQKIANE